MTIIPAVSSLSLTTDGITKPLFVSCTSDAMGDVSSFASSSESGGDYLIAEAASFKFLRVCAVDVWFVACSLYL